MRKKGNPIKPKKLEGEADIKKPRYNKHGYLGRKLDEKDKPITIKWDQEAVDVISKDILAWSKLPDSFFINDFWNARDMHHTSVANIEKWSGWDATYEKVKKNIADNFMKRGMTDRNAMTMCIFALKTRYGHNDRQIIEHAGSISFNAADIIKNAKGKKKDEENSKDK